MDEFTAKSYRLPDVVENMRCKHTKYIEQCQDVITLSGRKIHALVHKALHSLGISEVSPGWQNFLLEIEQLVVDGMKSSVISALHAMRCAMDPSALGQCEVSYTVTCIYIFHSMTVKVRFTKFSVDLFWYSNLKRGIPV